MKCDRAEALLMPLVDRELDPWRSWRATRHVARCTRCGAEHRALLASRDLVRAKVPRHDAPDDLVVALRRRFAAGVASRPPSSERIRWWATGALAGSCATIVMGLATVAWLDRVDADDRSERLVTAHTRAVVGGTQIAVASSDHHRIKPWLSAQLDYSPPVDDLAATGFPLAGARIDIVGGKRTAVLVYRYRDHTIDVFVGPAGDAPQPTGERTVRGFHVLAARGQAMDWTTVSDANSEAVGTLLDRLAHGP